MWSYVADVLGFYDERIANETYLRTAVRRPSLRRIVGMLGYVPAPGVAGTAVVAAIAEGNVGVNVPAGTALRSTSFVSPPPDSTNQPPQVFEVTADTPIQAQGVSKHCINAPGYQAAIGLPSVTRLNSKFPRLGAALAPSDSSVPAVPIRVSRGAMKIYVRLCAVPFVVLVGCTSAQSPGSSTPVGVSACAEGKATGQWSGTATGPTGHWTFVGTFWQDGTKLRGKVRSSNTDDSGMAQIDIEGSIDCSTRAFTLHGVNTVNQYGERTLTSFSGSLSADFASMTATWDNVGKVTAKKR